MFKFLQDLEKRSYHNSKVKQVALKVHFTSKPSKIIVYSLYELSTPELEFLVILLKKKTRRGRPR